MFKAAGNVNEDERRGIEQLDGLFCGLNRPVHRLVLYLGFGLGKLFEGFSDGVAQFFGVAGFRETKEILAVLSVPTCWMESPGKFFMPSRAVLTRSRSPFYQT